MMSMKIYNKFIKWAAKLLTKKKIIKQAKCPNTIYDNSIMRMLEDANAFDRRTSTFLL